MFARWQLYRSQALYPRHAERSDSRARLKAILVESVRINGKPRQKHIAFLGSIASDASIDDPAGWRFWRDVTMKLDRLGDRISPEERERVIASIAVKVGAGPPSEAEFAQHERAAKEAVEKLIAGFGAYRRAPRPIRRRRTLRERFEEAAQKCADLRNKLDQETMKAWRSKRAPEA